MAQADFAVINLKRAITSSHRLWAGAHKAFYFGAPPEAAVRLAAAGVDRVSLANNHITIFWTLARRDCGIPWPYCGNKAWPLPGAGANLTEASAPAVVERNGIRFDLVVFCDHQEDFAAGRDTAGMAYLDLDDDPGALRAFQEGLQRMRKAGVDWPVLSLHWGSNWAQTPTPHFVRLAHAAINMGYALIYGHSAHIFQGIENYCGHPNSLFRRRLDGRLLHGPSLPQQRATPFRVGAARI